MTPSTTRLIVNVRAHDLDAARLLLADARRHDDTQLAHEACDALVGAGEWVEALAWYEAQEQPCKYCDGNGCRHCDCKLCGCGLCSCCNGHCRCETRPIKPRPTHTLCNAVGRVGALARGYRPFGGFIPMYKHPLPPPKPVLELWVRCLRLWWPSGWFGWWPTDASGGGSYSGQWGRLDGSVFFPQELGLAPFEVHRDGTVRCEGTALPPLPIVPECVCVDAGVERGRCPECCRPSFLHYSSIDVRCSGHCPRCGS